jgi:hypothetical protein
MAAWKAWYEGAGGAVVDLGAPLDNRIVGEEKAGAGKPAPAFLGSNQLS